MTPIEEFEQQYAARSGVTVEWLHEHGRFGVPCYCGDEVCEGFAMGHSDSIPSVLIDETSNHLPL